MTNKPTVFVVDDDQAVRESLSILLASRNIQCKCYATAAQFLDSFDESNSGCLVVDIRMPGIDGIELHHQMTSRGIHIPTIVMTGNANIETCAEVMKRGVLDFIQKPFHPEKLLRTITRALESLCPANQGAQV